MQVVQDNETKNRNTGATERRTTPRAAKQSEPDLNNLPLILRAYK